MPSRARPLSIYVDTHGTGVVPEAVIEKAVAEVMDLTPRGIRTHLSLNRPSMRAPRPMAISAAAPTPTAASRGSGRTLRAAEGLGSGLMGRDGR